MWHRGARSATRVRLAHWQQPPRHAVAHVSVRTLLTACGRVKSCGCLPAISNELHRNTRPTTISKRNSSSSSNDDKRAHIFSETSCRTFFQRLTCCCHCATGIELHSHSTDCSKTRHKISWKEQITSSTRRHDHVATWIAEFALPSSSQRGGSDSRHFITAEVNTFSHNTIIEL